jgi:hypothetical protein
MRRSNPPRCRHRAACTDNQAHGPRPKSRGGRFSGWPSLLLLLRIYNGARSVLVIAASKVAPM